MEGLQCGKAVVAINVPPPLGSCHAAPSDVSSASDQHFVDGEGNRLPGTRIGWIRMHTLGSSVYTLGFALLALDSFWRSAPITGGVFAGVAVAFPLLGAILACRGYAYWKEENEYGEMVSRWTCPNCSNTYGTESDYTRMAPGRERLEVDPDVGVICVHCKWITVFARNGDPFPGGTDSRIPLEILPDDDEPTGST